jgi:hypothetical protein
MEMMIPGNRFPAIRPFYLLVWNEDYEAVGIPLLRSYADEKKVCLMLNVRPNLIEEETPQTIADTVRTLIRQGAGRGRFALLLNLIPVGTPAEIVHAAVAAARQFGRYPIPEDLEAIAFRPPAFLPFDAWVRDNGLPL